MSVHLPARMARPLYRQCIFQRPCARPFSTTIARPGKASRKKKRIDPIQTEVAARQEGRRGKAASTLYEEQLRDDRNLPDDIGILPGTFILAPFSKVWSRLSLSRPTTWKTVSWYYYKFLESKAKAWLLIWRFRKVTPNCPPLYFWHRKVIDAVAVEKYKHLYQSFARGNPAAISETCVSSVSQQFLDRIAARPRRMHMDWKADGVKARIVSNRGLLLALAGYQNTGIQQIVFQVTSKWQSVNIGNTKNKEGSNVVEYLVLQRQAIRGVFKEWKVWGFTNEWMPETIQEDADHEKQVNAYQAQAM
ncbi:hypothetical protein P280DRAFT_505557 [Massarina eburnea CBS 473.64]|uniref:Tim44-like domain-containing protein n=1 Tax=Massarina eburnea CBS 473.64 TaxID=1395130 RepID=A0A6A6S932_9PLEO|nr:hypothetical protein P280DRAFT_505557 [Massarina eburnea CBS 473.64]